MKQVKESNRINEAKMYQNDTVTNDKKQWWIEQKQIQKA